VVSSCAIGRQAILGRRQSFLEHKADDPVTTTAGKGRKKPDLPHLPALRTAHLAHQAKVAGIADLDPIRTAA
jgi:hypothetical protein